MTINIPITLDLLYKRPPIVVHAVQNDENTRIIKASLTSNGTAFTPTVGATAEFRLAKPDGTYCFYDADENDNPAVTISGSIVSVVLLAPALQAAGLGKAQIDLYDADGRLATFTFILDIEAATVPDDAISEDYVNVITGLVTEAVTSAAAAQAAQAAAESAANGTVHFDIAQTLTSAQKAQARTNIGAASDALSTDALELETGWTASGDRNQVSREGRRVVLNISARYSSAMSPNTANPVLLTTLAAKYRPAYAFYGVLYGYNATTPTLNRAEVNPDGTVNIIGTAAANASLRGVVVYDAAT